MTFETKLMAKFEDLSDEIIISIIEYLSLEDLILIFGKLNTRLSYIIFDHPWTQHQLYLQTIDNNTLKKKLDFIENMKLTTRISLIKIRPFSIYRSIEIFNQYKPLSNFVNLQALSLNNITLDEAESIFTSECLSKLNNLTHLCIIFSFGIEQNNYSQRFECLISKILIHPSLRHCIFRTAQSVEFSQLQSLSFVEYLNINYCNFQSLYTLFKFTPYLRHLTATIATINELKTEQISIPSSINSLKLILCISLYDELTNFLKKFSKLQKLNIITYSIIEPLIFTSSWFKLITEYLPSLTQFRRESNVALENIASYVEPFHWPNGWQFNEKRIANGSNYSRVIIINTRF
ncbi:unnamed protein product [Rotaria sordida]|uniref:F-box domain-containing protein n=1 Tax=Rotaria sordida TaxID=392033 RepID=A0A815XYU3_9BILA|nr:unnamed protein product [Rotaria sordida]CAF1563246.1 unnamed protein product [Rotaria sordida]